MNKRNELTNKFFRNLDLIVEFKLNYECYCDISESWDKPAFGDSGITNRQYYITLEQISNEEYSDNQCEAIKKVQIHENVLDEYILRLDSQYNNLKKPTNIKTNSPNKAILKSCLNLVLFSVSE